MPGQQRGAKLANARQDRRALEFTDAATWLRFNEKYGVGDSGIYDMLVGHLDGMARDVGMLEKLGPNPEATARTLIDTAVKAGAGDYRLRALYDHVSGASAIRDYTPGSTLWYTRLALDRMVWDRLNELADPDWRSQARQVHQRALKEQGQRFWWGPNDQAPVRAPSLGAAIGQPEPR